jgi:hypothetical protein
MRGLWFFSGEKLGHRKLEEVKTIYREQGVAPNEVPRIVERYIVPGKDIFTQMNQSVLWGSAIYVEKSEKLKAKAIADIKSNIS